MNKGLRLLSIWQRISQGEVINKREEAQRFLVAEKTIRRDIENIKSFLAQFYIDCFIKYDRKKRGYVLHANDTNWFSSKEVLAIIKILLESRAFSKDEVEKLIKKSLYFCIPENRRYIEDVISNERFHYIPARHTKQLFKILWDISCAIKEKKEIKIEYKKENEQIVNRDLKPQAIIFSEYYFYLLAFIKDEDYEFPAVYRIDRIENYCITDNHFYIPYPERFEDGKFRQRVQFMTTGKLIKIQFKFWGKSIEAVLDRLPTARIIDKIDNTYIIEAEVFGKGVMMWLLSQGKFVEVIKPESFRSEMKEVISEMLSHY